MKNLQKLSLEDLIDLLPQVLKFKKPLGKIPLPEYEHLPLKKRKEMERRGLLYITHPGNWVVLYVGYVIAGQRVFIPGKVTASKTLKEAIIKLLRYIHKNNIKVISYGE